MLSDLFRYHHWANGLVIAALVKFPVAEPAVWRLFSHQLLAHQLWNERLAGQSSELDYWAVLTPAELKELDTANHDRSLQLIGTLDWNTPVEYTKSGGATFSQPPAELLLHVSHHHNHHRGQVALLMRQAGLTPPATDYIYYLRQR